MDCKLLRVEDVHELESAVVFVPDAIAGELHFSEAKNVAGAIFPGVIFDGKTYKDRVVAVELDELKVYRGKRSSQGDGCENMKRRLSGEHIEPYKIRLRRKDGGEIIVQVFGTVIKWGGEVAGIVVAVDVTREEEKRKKLEELTTLLEFINKILRHDVLNALTSAAACLEVYDDMKDEAILHKAREAIERAVRVIKNMREFERIVKEGNLKIVSVREMAEEAAKGFAVTVNIKGDCNVLADDGLVTVFENLYQNAVQHGETERIDVEIRESDKFCEICVVDYGKGIPDEIKDRVFEEGFKYGEKASTGFGLYAVKKLIERYGGEIWIENNKPRGAVFVIRLMSV
ncbi:MAG: PAS domain-containing sensor histidine kinase [Archaeoglobus sp.]|uniref:PAS domain-containing sensor histidine kinase n=1 Tax=Archaeoglobus sp. TaxID=1872626 RepID=UPI001E198253|nr:PAS domain-containing sensor histidine kinase [Archaeoglobus sp.]MBO8180895.1 PAS domain-containing sensor histidine kinase [Archaeoglobus sp.]